MTLKVIFSVSMICLEGPVWREILIERSLYRAAEAGDNKHALEGIERITNIV